MSRASFQLPSAKQHNFSAQPQVRVNRSAFSISHQASFTFDVDYLVPFFHAEILPGDTLNLNARIFARLNTPKFPIMTNMWLDTHCWFVPYRLVWEHWVNFMGETVDPWVTDPTPPVYLTPISTIPVGGYAVGSLQDYLDFPVVSSSPSLTVAGLEHTVFNLRAYNLIWNQNYRDENLQDPVVVDTDDGPDTVTDYVLLKRGKRHDYFTSCLPFAQKGDPVTLAFSGNAPVIGTGETLGLTDGTQNFGLRGIVSLGLTTATGGYNIPVGAATGTTSVTGVAIGMGVTTDPNASGLVADMSNISAFTINDFRTAFLEQEYLEIDARGGTRYPEQIYAHFGVENPDSRVQYSEYLGGYSQRMDITAVPQTSATEVGSPQANLAAYGTLYSPRNGFVKSFTEHGVVICLMSVRADLVYSQGLPREYSRRTRFDYYAPVFANLGEQAVLNQEIYAQGTAGGTDDVETFGFQERWAEYRYMPSRLRGLFRPQVANTLAAWNLGQLFGALPVLGEEFIESSTPIDRTVVVTSQPDLKADVFFEGSFVRPMPVRSIPVKLGARW